MRSPDLQARKLRARRFCFEYNFDRIPNDPRLPAEKIFSTLRSRREEALRSIVGAVGEKPVIEPPFNFQYGVNITLGNSVYANVK
jgi:hypothetical protein